ncbi:MAG: DUF3568 family protein [Gemmataceae bacterium]
MNRGMRSIGWIILGLLTVAQAGCALAVAGAAAGAGAAGYMYMNGLVYRDYHANLGDTVAALRTSLVELQFPLLKEKNDTGSAYFQTQTSDGHTIKIYLDIVASPIPSEGSLTRVSIRVGFAGDDTVSGRILDQLSKHLVAPGAPPAAPPASGLVTPATPPPGATLPPAGTAPPPGAIVPAAVAPTASPTINAPRGPAETTAPPLAENGRLVPVAATAPGKK